MIRATFAGLAALFSSVALAHPPPANFEIRLGGGDYELDDSPVGDASADLGNIQARVEAPVTDSVFFRGSYSGWAADEIKVNGVTYQNDLEFNAWRLGAGIRGGEGVTFLGALEIMSEHDRLEGFESNTDEGFVVSGGVQDNRQGSFLWNVELGLVALGDSGGAVFDWGLGYRFTPSVAVLLGGQAYSLEDDDNVTTTVSTGSLGLQITF